MLSSIRDRINSFISRANDVLTFDADKPDNLRALILAQLGHFYELRAKIDAQIDVLPVADKPRGKSVRFALVLPSNGEDRPRFVYFIDGVATESKIAAIKQVRTTDGSGLKESKDLVDSLFDHAIALSTYGVVEVPL